MGSRDVVPDGVPSWLIEASTFCLGLGFLFWLVAYGLMIRRSLESGWTAMPILALGLNLSWELVFAVYVSDMALETVGFLGWLLLDVPLVYATIKTVPRSFGDQPLVRKHAVAILVTSFVVGTAAWGSFAFWWLAEPGRGSGSKVGKAWRGLERRDTTELAFWTACINQLANGIGAVAMLLQRGHSGGHGYTIWAFRAVGSQMGLTVSCGLLWWYWPAEHAYIWNPISITLLSTISFCDLAYPFVVAYVRRSEVVLEDGTVVAAWSSEARKKRA